MTNSEKLKSARVIGRNNPEGNQGKVWVYDKAFSLYDFIALAINDDIVQSGPIHQKIKEMIELIINDDITKKGPIYQRIKKTLEEEDSTS